MGTELPIAKSGWIAHLDEGQPRACECGTGPPPEYVRACSSWGHKQQVSHKSMFIFALVLRIAALLLSLGALACLVFAHDKYDSESGPFTFFVTIDGKALRTRANKLLAAMSVLIILYEGAHVGFAYLEKAKEEEVELMLGHVGTLLTFVSDQVLAYLLFAAGAAAANDVARWRRGVGPLDRVVCAGDWSSWCIKVEVGIAMSFFAFAALTMLAVISGFKFSKYLDHSEIKHSNY